MVQDDEDIRPELQFDFLGQGKVLHPGHIPLEKCRATKQVAPDVAYGRRIAPDAVESWFESERIDVVAGIWPTGVREFNRLSWNRVRPHVVAEESVRHFDVLRKAGASL